jgi:hypothetical protein
MKAKKLLSGASSWIGRVMQAAQAAVSGAKEAWVDSAAPPPAPMPPADEPDPVACESVARAARAFSGAIEKKTLTTKAFRRAVTRYLVRNRDAGVAYGLGREQFGVFATADGHILKPATPRLAAAMATMRAGIYANAARAAGMQEEEIRALIPAAGRTEENARTAQKFDGSFAKLLRP